ncbi:MAG TPA: nuclear transport factor 2 family protein [Streptosporangiaceae bacterium]|nr:nuclear transport factor 2 family protein [Streptosporangiaceae bacterium]
MSSPTAASVLARRRHLTLNGDADGLADLYAPDAVIEAPFAGHSGMPARLEGREAIREYSRQVTASPLRLEEYEVAELYQTQDPEVVIVEMTAKGTLTTTGRSFATTSIQVLRIRHGQIVLFRDFANPRVLEEVIREATSIGEPCSRA